MNSDDCLSSCQVQFEACESFLRSQRSHDWILLERFDDEGYSGATLDRPALQRLLAQARGHLVDPVVVHRLDRLSRSLLGYASAVMRAGSKRFAIWSDYFNA